MIACVKCNGKYGEHRRECPFCKAEAERKLGKKTDVKLTKDERVYNMYPSLVDEYERAKTVVVPASFTGMAPDTPESVAARRQLDISRGKDVPNY